MISVIICNRDKNILPSISENIKRTIGVEYELIIIDNSNNNYNIFQAYNIGVRRSKFSILCFMHDDIVYHSTEWGKIIYKYFQNDTKIGMIGIAGPTYMSKYPGIWWGCNGTGVSMNCNRQKSLDTNRENKSKSNLVVINPLNENYSEVVVLDGLFFCIRKCLFNKISFDENYKGFHFYDLDISMQVISQNYKCICIFDILVEHISNSKLDKTWLKASRQFYNKWKSKLPLSTYPYSHKQRYYLEYNNFDRMRRILEINNIKYSTYYNFQEFLSLIFRFSTHIIYNKIVRNVKII